MANATSELLNPRPKFKNRAQIKNHMGLSQAILAKSGEQCNCRDCLFTYENMQRWKLGVLQVATCIRLRLSINIFEQKIETCFQVLLLPYGCCRVFQTCKHCFV